MKKSIMALIGKYDKYIAWVSNDESLRIVGFATEKGREEWLRKQLLINEFRCTFGSYNGCSYELINRIIKAEEIL